MWQKKQNQSCLLPSHYNLAAKRKFPLQREKKKNFCLTQRDVEAKKIPVSLLPELGLACWWHSLYVLQG